MQLTTSEEIEAFRKKAAEEGGLAEFRPDPATGITTGRVLTLEESEEGWRQFYEELDENFRPRWQAAIINAGPAN